MDQGSSQPPSSSWRGPSEDLRRRLVGVIRGVRRRRNTRVLLRGLMVSLGVGLVVFLISSWAMDRLLYTERAVSVIRWLSWLTVAAVVLRSLVAPLFRRATDRQVALYIEEHEPALESALITSLELEADSPALSDPLADVLHQRLLVDTIERCERAELGRGIERTALQRATGGVALVTGCALLVALLSPAFVRHGASLLIFPWRTAAIDNPYGIEVAPRGGIFPKGADIRIQARLAGFVADVSVVRRATDGQEWQREIMIPGADHDQQFGVWEGGVRGSDSPHDDYELLILAADQSFQFYVEAAGIRSQVVDIEVIDLPYTEQIDLVYHFPSYSGLETEVVEDSGDIAALLGTRVEIRATPTMEAAAARLVLEGGKSIDMTRDGNLWGAEITVDQQTFYHLEMMDARGRFGRASADYGVRPLDDDPPMVTIRKPGRDVKVSKIEEVFVEVVASDDYGLRSIELEFSVNGGPLQSKTLRRLSGEQPEPKVTAGYTFFLEDFELRDGDFISYYANVTDGRPGAGSRKETSDIYFLEVRPFNQEYRKADSGGGGGEGGADSELSKRQREVVAATFRLTRDRKDFSTKEFNESVATVSLSQERLMEQVRTLMTRMSNRSTLMGDDDFTEILGHLESSLEPMGKAVTELAERDLAAALLSEQEALASLQRAEAMFRDVRVSFDASPGGGGQPGELAEDLADLFELELDKLKNQYETVQRDQQQSTDRQVDEVEERLRELARRQQKENERKQRLGQRSSAAGGGGSQQELIEQTEELARKLERLAREQASPELRQTAQQLERALDEMKRSGSEGEARAGSAGTGAARALEEARRLLDKSRQRNVEEGVSEARSAARRIAEQQSAVREEVESLSRQGESGMTREALQRLLQRKEQIQKEVQGLEEDLDRLARQSRTERPELARGLQQASNDLRVSGVGKKIEYSRGVLAQQDRELAARFERSIEDDLNALQKSVEAAAETSAESTGKSGDEALEKTRQLVEGLESLERRVSEAIGSRGEGQRLQKPGSSAEIGSGPGALGESQGEQAGTEEGSQRGGGSSREAQTPGSEAKGRTGQSPGEGEQDGSPSSGSPGGGQEGREGQSGQGGQTPTEGRTGRDSPGRGEQGSAEGTSAGRRAGLGAPTMGSGSSSGEFQPGAFTEEDIRQLSREVRQRLAETSELRRSLEGQGVETSNLREIERQMSRFDTRRLTSDPLALEALRRNIEDLRQFEFTLWRTLGNEVGEVRSPKAQKIPEGYEEQAERYFRALAKSDNGG